MKTTSFMAVVVCLLLTACATVGPSSENLRQIAVGYLGTPQDMGLSKPVVAMEPTGIRWTIYRAPAPIDGNQIQSGGNVNYMLKSKDGPLGIDFGNGLFLDSKGNLTLMPLTLFKDFQWVPGVRYETTVGEEIWDRGKVTAYDLVKSDKGFDVTKQELFAPKLTFVPGQFEGVAMDRKVGRNDDGALTESSALPVIDIFHKYETKEHSIRHTISLLGDTVILYRWSDQGVAADDDSFTLKTEGDHWTISLQLKDGLKQWQYYVSGNKAILIDTSNGATATMETSEKGLALATPDRKESIAPKP